MAGRRLVPVDRVEQWDGDLTAAVHRALAAQRRSVHAHLRSYGFTAASPPKRALRAVGTVWVADTWAEHVNREVTPTANKVAKEATDAVGAAVAITLAWGAASSAAKIAGAITDRALASGKSIGDRLNANVAATTNVDQVLSDVMDTAPDILANVVGGSATMAAELASSDLTSYVAGYFGNIYSDATRTWNAVGDDHTREWHLDADGQEVGLNEPFIVMGEELTGPGDPSGSDENVINCRCWTTTDGLDPAEAIYGEDASQ